MSNIKQKILQNRLIQHSLFWITSYYILIRIFANSSEIHPVDHLYTFLFHITLFIGVYTNLFWLIPFFFYKGRTALYLLLLVLVLLASAIFNIWFFGFLVDFIFPGYYFISYYELWDILQFFIAYMGITSLLKLSRSWFKLSETEKRLAEVEREKLNTELKALKSQINPHFLFNSLNSLYSLSLQGDKNTSNIILRLSETMRYMLYESNERLVSLSKEINFIKNYIDLQRLRSDDNAEITFQIIGNVDHQKIAPLIFISFIENGFKHGIKGETGKSFVNILVKIENNTINLEVKNNKGVIDEMENDQYRGIGLKNVKQRLLLIYPEKHQLSIIDEKQIFSVYLKIDLL